MCCSKPPVVLGASACALLALAFVLFSSNHGFSVQNYTVFPMSALYFQICFCVRKSLSPQGFETTSEATSLGIYYCTNFGNFTLLNIIIMECKVIFVRSEVS